jgi:hypothetical protein
MLRQVVRHGARDHLTTRCSVLPAWWDSME